MSGSVKLGLYILIGVVVGYFALKFLLALVWTFLPVLILVGVGLLVVGVVSRKALGGSRRTLP
ncbi:MAG: hypothetical protein QOJ65_2100 [Fimbriimonadaceae bacterium]|jgi:hypothetical protein|nr:hypothetical protein [Fimbriimonadaceae bacterium]